MTKTIVTLGDSSLTTGDLSLLVPPNWLNDQLLSFWMEHLRINVLQNDPRVAVILPNISYFIALTNDEEDLRPIAAAHLLNTKNFILVPVNDATDTDVENVRGPVGSHWSLLVFHRPENTIFHIDSLRSSSYVRQHVSHHLVHRLMHMSAAPNAKFMSLKPPAQHNSYDCGAFVCLFAQQCAQRFLKGCKIADMFPKGQFVSQEEIDSFRQDIGKVACRLFDEKHRSDNPPSSS